MDAWRLALGARTRSTPSDYVKQFLATSGFLESAEEISADLVAEIAGIAQASNQPFEDLLVYNLMDEEWRIGRDPDAGCSVVAYRVENGPTRAMHIAQNMDLPVSMGSSQIMLRIAEHNSEPAQMVLSAAGMIGLLGVNAAGLACCVNTLAGLPGAQSGLPVSFVVREVLKLRDLDGASELLSRIPHASGQHYALADASSVRGYECSSHGCAPGSLSTSLAHTNHPLWWDGEVVDFTPAGIPVTTHERLDALQDALPEIVRSRSAVHFLSSTDSGLCVIPVEKKPTATFLSAEFELGTTPPIVRAALGRPDRTPWHTYEWA